MTNTTTTAPHGILCGHCHLHHASVDEVKACYGHPVAVATIVVSSQPMALGVSITVPQSKYALANLAGHGNAVTFFDVHYGKKGTKWDGFLFLSRLVGHPGSFQEYPVKGAAKAIVLQKIADDPKAAAQLFAEEFSVCARCGATLTDDESRARGLGPTCAEAFA